LKSRKSVTQSLQAKKCHLFNLLLCHSVCLAQQQRNNVGGFQIDEAFIIEAKFGPALKERLVADDRMIRKQ
jgi:hypothetical protein